MIVVFVVDTSPSMAAAANSSGGDRGTGVIGKQIFMLKYVIYMLFFTSISNINLSISNTTDILLLQPRGVYPNSTLPRCQ